MIEEFKQELEMADDEYVKALKKQTSSINFLIK